MEQTEMLKYIRIVRQQPESIKKIDHQILIEHPEICLEVIQINADNIKFIPMCICQVKNGPFYN